MPLITKTDLPESATLQQQRFPVMYALKQAGHSLEDIGEMYGVTRERVRQIIERGCLEAGLLVPARAPTKTRAGKLTVDPRQVMQMVRQPTTLSYRQMAETLGVGAQAIETLVHALGLRPAVKRLFYWRRNFKRRQYLLQIMRDAAAKYGHTPTSAELVEFTGTAIFVQFHNYFGSLRNAQAAAGFLPNTPGGGPQRMFRKLGIDNGTKARRERLLSAIWEAATMLGRVPTMKEVEELTGAPVAGVWNLFGSWREAVALAKLPAHYAPVRMGRK